MAEEINYIGAETGRSLMGHMKGDNVTFEAPMGVLHYVITDVEN